MPRVKARRKQRRGRPSAVSRLSAAQIVAELNRRRDMLDHLRRTRASLVDELASLDAQIADIEPLDAMAPASQRRGPGWPNGTGSDRGRGKNKKSLAALLHVLLQGKTMSVPEMAVAAKKAGHKSKSKNFRAVVSLAILNNRKMFTRVARGQYTAR